MKQNTFNNKIIFIFLFLLIFSNLIYSQTIKPNKYGLKVVDDINLYNKLVQQDSTKKLVDLEKYIPGIKLDIRYATNNNFTKKILYKEAKAFLRLPAANALKKIQSELKKKNLELKIYDAYRPYSITEILWENVKDARYASDPRKGSRHNRGCAVDLTIIDSKTGKEIPMPTEYDNFTVKAHHSYMNLPKEVIKNRKILRDVMEKYGFKIITSEWWHYDFIGWSKYELLNIPFEELEQN